MTHEIRRPLLVWILSSLVLLAVAAQLDNGLLVAAIYVGVNAIGVGIVLSRQPPYEPRMMRVFMWCAAAQLPVLFVPLFDRDLTDPGGHKRTNRDRFFKSDQRGADLDP